MHEFRVWAPAASGVEVEIDGERRVAMEPAGGGWWSVVDQAAGAGTRYWFRVDGGQPRPDPRSPSQPDGVHGPSQVVDHDACLRQRSDHHWRGLPLTSAVIYELHVGTFTPAGTFEAAIDRLDHLVELGIDVVELLPVAEFPGERGWGYDGVDLYAVHHAYGGPAGLHRFVDACHQRGLGVVMDVVYNHLGPAGNYLAEFGPYFTDKYATPWGQAVNLDGPDSDEVRAFFIDNALMWLRDYRCDGLRLDAVHAIVDTSAVHLLEELAARVRELEAVTGRSLFLIAESDLNDPRVVWRREMGGYGCDAQWSDDFHHAIHALLTGERSGYYEDFGGFAHLAKALRHAFVYDGIYAPHRRRRHGRPATGLSGHRFLGYSQNHDQVGNRAQGERLSHLVSAGKAKAAAALVLTAPFVPMLFQGEEWAATSPFQYFTDHQEEELGTAVREGRRREFAAFGWNPEDVPDPQDPSTFERSKLVWEERGHGEQGSMLSWYTKLVDLRRRHPDLRDGRLDRVEVRYDEVARWLVVIRGGITVAVNVGHRPVTIDLGDRPGDITLASDDACRWERPHLDLPPDATAILAP